MKNQIVLITNEAGDLAGIIFKDKLSDIEFNNLFNELECNETFSNPGKKKQWIVQIGKTQKIERVIPESLVICENFSKSIGFTLSGSNTSLWLHSFIDLWNNDKNVREVAAKLKKISNHEVKVLIKNGYEPLLDLIRILVI